MKMQDKILITSINFETNIKESYLLINNYLKDFYSSKKNVEALELMSSYPNYRLNFDKKVKLYANFLSRIYKDVANKILDKNFEQPFYNSFFNYFAESHVRLSLSRFYKLKLSRKFSNVISINKVESFNTAFQTTIDFQSYYQVNLLNNLDISDYLNSQILKHKLVNFDFIRTQNLNINKNEKEKVILNYNKNLIKTSIYNFYNYLINTFDKRKPIVIHNTFLTKSEDILLQLCLFRLPRIFNKIPLSNCQKNNLLRKEFKNKYLDKKNSSLENYLIDTCFELMPTCFLENLGDVEKFSKNFFPKNPLIIFTANAFASDEVFRFWSSKHVDKLMIAQHGCNYGTIKYKINPSHEETFCKKFFTWGLKTHKNHYEGFNYLKKKIKKRNIINKKISIIMYAQKGEFFFDEFFDYKKYMDFHKNFVDKLKNKFPDYKISLKLHKTHKKNLINEIFFWRNNFPDIEIVKDDFDVEDLINSSYLTIFTYDSTDFLKSLHFDKNIFLLSHSGLEHLRDDVKDYFKILIDNNIIFFKTDEIINFFGDNITNLNEFTSNKKIKISKVKFNNQINKNCSPRIINLARKIKSFQVSLLS
jgi:putative transferase (TIGR04331 family)